jgi:nitrilase
MVVDPWGVVLAQQATGPGVVVAELDRAHLDDVRRRLPALQHRRL